MIPKIIEPVCLNLLLPGTATFDFPLKLSVLILGACSPGCSLPGVPPVSAAANFVQA